MFETRVVDEVGGVSLVIADPLHPFCFKPLACYDEGAPKRVAINIINGHESYTMLSPDQRSIGILGASFMFTHAMTFWALLGELTPKYPVAVHKLMGEYIGRLISRYKLKRVQTFVDVNNLRAIRQNEALGFHQEGVLKKFGPLGQDQIIFARMEE